MLIENLDSKYFISPDGRKVRKAIDSPFIHKLQRRHFFYFNIFPVVGTVLALALLPYVPFTWPEVVVCLVMWAISGLGITVGYHRLAAHKTFKATQNTRLALAIAGSTAGLGSIISWAAIHRRHHECSDKEGDMHSPNLHGKDFGGRVRGFVHAHITWMLKHEFPNVNHYVPDLMNDQRLLSVSRHYSLWVLLGIAIPAVACGLLAGSWWGVLNGILWGGAVRIFIVANSMWCLNSLMHTIGRKTYKTKDESGNSLILSLISWGEGWHNNHHAFPRSANFGLKWYRIDPGYWLIVTLEKLGLASDVYVPPPDRVASRAKKFPGPSSATEH